MFPSTTSSSQTSNEKIGKTMLNYRQLASQQRSHHRDLLGAPSSRHFLDGTCGGQEFQQRPLRVKEYPPLDLLGGHSGHHTNTTISARNIDTLLGAASILNRTSLHEGQMQQRCSALTATPPARIIECGVSPYLLGLKENYSLTKLVDADNSASLSAQLRREESPADRMMRFFTGKPCSARTRKCKAIKFPLKLMYAIECGDYEGILSWNHGGLSFKIERQREFEETVLPEIFKDAKFASFRRKLNRWGFQRHRGVSHFTVSHPHFRSGNFRLCEMISCSNSDMDKNSEAARSLMSGQNEDASKHCQNTNIKNNEKKKSSRPSSSSSSSQELREAECLEKKTLQTTEASPASKLKVAEPTSMNMSSSTSPPLRNFSSNEHALLKSSMLRGAGDLFPGGRIVDDDYHVTLSSKKTDPPLFVKEMENRIQNSLNIPPKYSGLDHLLKKRALALALRENKSQYTHITKKPQSAMLQKLMRLRALKLEEAMLRRDMENLHSERHDLLPGAAAPPHQSIGNGRNQVREVFSVAVDARQNLQQKAWNNNARGVDNNKSPDQIIRDAMEVLRRAP